MAKRAYCIERAGHDVGSIHPSGYDIAAWMKRNNTMSRTLSMQTSMQPFCTKARLPWHMRSIVSFETGRPGVHLNAHQEPGAASGTHHGAQLGKCGKNRCGAAELLARLSKLEARRCCEPTQCAQSIPCSVRAPAPIPSSLLSSPHLLSSTLPGGLSSPLPPLSKTPLLASKPLPQPLSL